MSLFLNLSRPERWRNVFFPLLGGMAAVLILKPAPAAALSLDELQTKMQESEAALQGVQFDYRQEMRSELTPEVKRSSGTAYILRPRNIRIEQKAPSSQLIVSEGRTVYVYTPQFRQVLRDSWKKWFSSNVVFPGLLTFSDTYGSLKRDYAWEMLPPRNLDGQEMLAVRLRPLDEKKTESLELWISPEDYMPRKAEWSSGTLSLATVLSSVKRNPDMPPGLFKFKKPENSSIIEVP